MISQTDMVSHTCDVSTREAGTGGCHRISILASMDYKVSSRQPRLHSRTLPERRAEIYY